MTRFLSVILLSLWCALPVQAQDRETAIQGVISQQFQAFQADDFSAAFDFASPMIKGMFGTPERFGQMVTSGYPMVHRPADVRFTGTEERAGRTYQNVVVTDQSGALHLLEYEMIQTDNGWQINGVLIKRPGALGA